MEYLYWIWVVAQVFLVIVSLRFIVWIFFVIIEQVSNVSIAVTGFKVYCIDEIKIKTKNSDVEFTKVCFSLSRMTRGFITVSVGCVKAQQTRSSEEHSADHSKPSSLRKPSLKRRLLNLLLKLLSQVFQLSIAKVELAVHHVVSPSLGYLDVIRISGGVKMSTHPAHYNTLDLLVDVSKLAYESWICFGPEANSSHQALEGTVSLTTELSLTLLSPTGRWAESVQVGVSSFNLQLQAAAVAQLKERFSTTAQSRSDTGSRGDIGSVSMKMPSKVEVLLNQPSFQYIASSGNRFLELEVGKSSLILEGLEGEDLKNHNLRIYVEDVMLKPHPSKTMFGLKQAHVDAKFEDCELKINLNLMTIKSHLEYDELFYWKKQIPKLNPPPTDGANQSLFERLSQIPFTIVTTTEVSDWLLSVTLSGSDPACQFTCASGTLRAGLSQMEKGFRPLRLVNSYMNISGEGIRDNPAVLPLSETHCRGRVLSVGSATFNLAVVDPSSMNIELTGQSWIFEWSEGMVTTVTTLLDALHTPKPHTKEDMTEGGLASATISFRVKFSLNGLNVFVIMGSETPALMSRVDSIYLSTNDGDSDLTLTLFKLALEYVVIPKDTSCFQCCSVANLPDGGLLFGEQTQVTFWRDKQAINVSCTKPVLEWSPGTHLSLSRTIRNVTHQARRIKNTLVSPSTDTPPSVPASTVGERLTAMLQKVPLTMHFEVDKGLCNVSLGHEKKREVVVSIVTGHCSVGKDSLSADVYQFELLFDKQQFFSLDGLQVKFPHHISEERTLANQILIKDNVALCFTMLRAEVYFANEYKFYLTYEKLMSVRKFIMSQGSSISGSASGVSPLPLDVLIEVDDIVVQFEDDPMEVKLRANYELMCDEVDQRQMRQSALDQKLEDIRQEQGRLFSVKLVQNLKESLEMTNDEIYCQRAREMYCNEPLRTELVSLNLNQTRLVLMSDTSLSGRDNLVEQIREIDSHSPLPDNYSFSTLWGVYINAHSRHVELQLRDYPWKVFESKNLDVCGKLIFGEQEAYHDRECYTVPISVGPFWEETPSVTRKLPPLKYYHDLTIESSGLEISWGPCLDPAFAQVNYAFNFITKPALDPSPPLPWWDKARLLLHGRATLHSSNLTVNLLSSTNPYSDTEFLDIQLIDVKVGLVDNVSLSVRGGLNIFVHTASRYDECQLLTLPLVDIDVGYQFICEGDSPNHHSVTRCFNSKLPLSAEGQEHDSYRLFRSHNMTFSLSLNVEHKDVSPEVLLYASTLRWLQKCVELLRLHVSRPIRRGRVHNNVRPKKKRFTRQIKSISISGSIPRTVVYYWSSVTKQQGLMIEIGKCSFKLTQQLQLISHSDGLVRRPLPEWSVSCCDGSVTDLAIYCCVQKQEVVDIVADDESVVIQNPQAFDHTFEKRSVVFLSELSYIREAPTQERTAEFKHQLKTNNTKMVWSKFNRNVIYKILNSFNLYKRLKRDLSADALKSVFSQVDTSPPVDADQSPASTEAAEKLEESSDGSDVKASVKSHLQRHNSGCMMLDQLLSDICNTLVSSEEMREPSDPKLKGIAAANASDVEHHNWFIELLNTQVALQGVEKKGFVVCSSYVAQVFGREHDPQLRGGDLVTKNSWVAKVQDLQYFCTIDGDHNGSCNIPWLPPSIVKPPGSMSSKEENPDQETLTSLLLKQLGPDLAHPVGAQEMMSSRPPGEAVGGLVTSVPIRGMFYEETPPSLSELQSNDMQQLQRIASRCHCQIFYVSYGDVVSDNSPTLPAAAAASSEKGFSKSKDAVDTFTFRYPSAEVSTTSFQYGLIMDIVNNLLLYKEPRSKETTEQHARLKFMLQLSSLSEKDIRKLILAKQNKIRQVLDRLKTIESELYIEHRNVQSMENIVRLEQELSFAKEELFQSSVELRAMIRAFKEKRLSFAMPSNSSSIPPEPTRRIEVWLDDAQWCLMHNDGQLQVSEIRFTNFSYNRVSFTDDSGEHRFELGSFRVKNCMPNTPSAYQEVLSPYDPASRRLRVDKNVSLRIYCRDQSPVAGIPVTEHLELNVVPLAVRLTERFYNTLQEYFLPRAEAEPRELSSDPDRSNVFGVQPTYTGSGDLIDGGVSSKPSSVKRTSNTSATPHSPVVKETKWRGSKRPASDKVDDVEKMKTRASKIKTFIYVKIPQTTLCITYKGEGISVKEMYDQIVTIQTLEYHNLNLSWRALLLEIKKDYKNAIIAQTLKSAIGIKETDEKAGLSSPKLGRSTSDILMGRTKEAKTRTRKVFSKPDADRTSISHEGVAADYTPPLSDNERRKFKLHSLTEKK